MNVFVPYQSPLECAKALYGDRRFNKQIIECCQILTAIDGTSKAWCNHPVVKMYKYDTDWLLCYTKCLESFRDYMNTKKISFLELAKVWDYNAKWCRPQFLTEDFCIQHRKRLYSKNPEHYRQFAEYGTSEENWYYDNEAQKIIKYINGKRIE